MKEITFSNSKRAEEVALSMNKKAVRLQDNMTRGTSYYRWLFDHGSAVVNFAHGQGNKNGRFMEFWLVKGTARKVGRDESDLEFYGESVTAES